MAVVTLVWAVIVYTFNVLVDVNHGYLVRKPESASPIDLLGAWPVYVVASLGSLLVGRAVITWLWVAWQGPWSPDR